MRATTSGWEMVWPQSMARARFSYAWRRTRLERNSSRGISDITSMTRGSLTPLGSSCSATILCAGVLMALVEVPQEGRPRDLGIQVVPRRRRGWPEEERICRCVTTKGRAPQRTDRAAWGPKIRSVSPVAPLTLSVQSRRFLGVVCPPSRPRKMAPPRQAAIAPRSAIGPGAFAHRIRAPIRAGVRPLPRLLPHPLGLRAGVVPDRVGRHARVGDVHAGLLPARARPLRRADDYEAVARDPEEPQTADAARDLSGRQRPPALPQGLPAAARQGRLRSSRGPEPAQAGHRQHPHLAG